jgi:hypothetical protein
MFRVVAEPNGSGRTSSGATVTTMIVQGDRCNQQGCATRLSTNEAAPPRYE